jgi:hypothetical protein
MEPAANMSESSLPPALRREIARTLEPVTPVASPPRRAARFAFVCAGVLVCVPLIWGTGHRLLPPELLGVGWVLQTSTAVLVLTAAIRESTPGRLLSPLQLGAVLLAVVLVQALWTAGWFAVAPWSPPQRLHARVLRVCLSREYVLGLVPLAIVVAGLRRGLISRPAVAGGLAGLAAGLAVESSWRVYCAITTPMHTLAGHMGAVALLAATGALAGTLFRRRASA